MKELTKHQRELKDQRRCIYCGQKVMPRYNYKHDKFYPDECSDCWKSQHRQDDMLDYGPATASVQHEFARRIGASMRGISQEDEDDE